MQTRKPEFDLVKAVAMYLVVAGHLFDMAGYPAIGMNMCHVPALYFSSGYLALSSTEIYSGSELFRRKCTSLAVPYMIWSSISLAANLILMALQGRLSKPSVWTEFVEIFVHARSVWFLVQLFVAFGVFLICLRLSKQRGWNLLLVNGITYMILCWLLPDTLFAFTKFKWLYPFFLLGYFTAKNREKIQKCTYLWILSVMSLLYPVLVCRFIGPNRFEQYTTAAYKDSFDFAAGIGCYILSILGIILLFTIGTILARTGFSRLLGEIGTYSIDIYVTHMLCIKFLPIVSVFGESDYQQIFLLIYAAVIVLFIFLAVKFFLRKIPFYCAVIGRKRLSLNKIAGEYCENSIINREDRLC